MIRPRRRVRLIPSCAVPIGNRAAGRYSYNILAALNLPPAASGVKVRQMPDTKQKLLSQGGEPVGTTPEQWAKVVKAANIKAD